MANLAGHKYYCFMHNIYYGFTFVSSNVIFLLQLVRTFYVKSVSIGSQSINVSVSGGRGLVN